MTTYYVKVGGNDTLNGLTWGNAWATVNKAATTATAGDLIIYGNGIYYLGAGQATWNSGTVGNVITHQAFNRRLAAWEQSASGSTVQIQHDDHHLRFNGLCIKGDDTHAQTALFYILYNAAGRAHHITLNDCELGDSSETWHGLYIRQAHDITVVDSIIHPNNGALADAGDGINIAGNCADILIENTEIYYCHHCGIDLNQCNVALIDNCHIHHTGSHGIGIGDTGDTGWTLDDITVSDCVIHDSDTTYNHTGSYHSNVRITNSASNVTILRNELRDASCYGLYLGSQLTGPVNIYNNTIYNQGLDVATEGNAVLDNVDAIDNIAGNINFKNNIVFVTQVGPLALKVGTRFDSWIQADYNLYYSSSATKSIRRAGTTYTSFADYKTAGFEPNAVIDDDPDFIDPANADFTLQGSSPAINEGVDIGQAFYGSAPDIGAHEYEKQCVICTIT